MITGKKNIFRPQWRRGALLALLLLGQRVHAQDVPNRFLFIFDTSSDMKNRVKAGQFEVTQILATSMGGQLHEGDSVGVWAFDQTLRAGQFPLATWAPEDANDIASGINAFLHDQHYSGTTSFAVLQPLLNQVIRNAPRLTVIIFSDGGDEIKGTPYDDGINQLFEQRKEIQAKAKEPFILVLRTQLGQYVGSTMNFPPGMLNLPDFPPMPEPAPVVTRTTPAPAPAPPPPAVQPLIIVGRTVMDHEPPPGYVPENDSPPKPANTPPPVVTNTVIVTNTLVVTNTVVPTDNPPFNHKTALALGGGLLIAAAGLITLIVSRSRNADRSSLITRSMRKD